MPVEQEIEAILGADPYSGNGGAPLALDVRAYPGDPKGGGGQESQNFLLYGQNLLEIMRRLVVYWTPERVEEAALARAADAGGPTSLSREVALLSAHFFAKWSAALETWGRSYHTRREPVFHQATVLHGFLTETIQALERRSAALEARALDLRLREDFRRLREVFAERHVGTEIARAVVDASRTEDDARLSEIARLLDDRVRPVEQWIADIHASHVMIEPFVVREFQKAVLPAERWKDAAKRLIAAGVQSGAVKAVLKYLGVG